MEKYLKFKKDTDEVSELIIPVEDRFEWLENAIQYLEDNHCVILNKDKLFEYV